MMNNCFKCGISGDKALLLGAVTEKGIQKICRKCSFEENIPIMKYFKEELEKKPSVSERLSRLSGVEIKKQEISEKDLELKKLADENFKKQVLEEKPFGMVDNFHWVIMRARRSKKLTQKQFAEKIEESEEAIIMVEKGVLPKNNFVLVSKIENYLGIKIRNELAREQSFEEDVEKVKDEFAKNVEGDKIKFDDITARTLTISDLQEMKKKREEKIFNEKEKSPKSEEKNNDVLKEEIDRIIFGK